MKTRAVKFNWEIMGAELANLSSNEQNAFFRSFAKEILHNLTHCEKEMQLLAIVQGSCPGERRLLKEELEVYETLGSISK